MNGGGDTGDTVNDPPLNQADTQPSAWNTPLASFLNDSESEVTGWYSKIALAKANWAEFKSCNPGFLEKLSPDKVEELE